MENTKKIYLKDMDAERRDYLIKLNKKLIEMLQSDLYENNMFLQGDTFTYIFGKNSHEFLEIRDHYNSCHLVLKDYRKFLTNLDADYLTTDARKLYDKTIKKLDTLDGLDPYCNNHARLEAWIEVNCIDILKDAEDYLHEFEDYPSEDDAIQYAYEMEQLEEYYIEEREDGTSDNVIRKDIAYIECYI